MAKDILGSLIIQLSGQTTAFAKSMTDAKQLAFTTSGEIVASLRTVTDQMSRLKFDNASDWKRSTDVIAGSIAGIGIAVAGATVTIAKQTAEQAKEMTKLSQSYGLPVAMISQLRAASAITGVSMEQLTLGMGRLAKAAATAAEGGKQQQQAFATLGVAYTDNAGHLRPMNDLLLDVASRFSKLQDGTGKTALAMQLFGRSGAALIPFLDRGRDGVKELLDMSDQLGLTWSESDVKAAADFQERLEILDLKGTALKENLAKGVIPALDQLASAFITVDSKGNSVAKSLGESVGSVMLEIARYFKSSEIEALKFIEVLKSIGPYGIPNLKDRLAALNKEFADFNQQLTNPAAVPASGGGGGGGTGGSPTFSGKAPKESGLGALEGYLNRARELFNTAEGDPLATHISNIQALQQQLRQFAAEHPDAIYLQINEAIEKLNGAVEHYRLLQGAVTSLAGGSRAGEDNLGAALSSPVGHTATASGEVQSQSQLIDLTRDLNEQNRMRLQLYEQLRTPTEQYADTVARLNILFQDKSSREYILAMQDAKLMIGDVKDGLEYFFRRMTEDSASWAQKTVQAMQSISAGMSNSIGRGMTDMIMGTKKVGAAFAEMGVGILQSIVWACTQMIAQWLVTHIIMAAISKIFHLGEAVSASTESATQGATNTALATSAAFLGAANAYAFWAWNPPVAAAMAAAALGVGLGFAASAGTAAVAGAVVPSAAGGTEVTQDGLHMLHQKEVVLPAPLARGFRNIMDTFNTPAPGRGHMAFAGAGGLNSPMTFHVNGANDPVTTANKIADVVTARIKRIARGKGFR